ncbi:MFS transporter (plasmid) [Streptomyces sp. NBC_01232]|uniref:MFS transporter n=1 Tax=Streptomyces sp. NBC_01232 TaxID=2903786 RepID=UPI002E124DF1|nr:MFS transporter [Streptomyces sp. NBC_01232]WSQ03274.1 MFS transporter [Streptomyces sp. NBC_01232]WSQ03883.1 MFS transporter [Streptomyces sp. NBC_01232]
MDEPELTPTAVPQEAPAPEVTPAAAYANALRKAVHGYRAAGGTQKKVAAALHISPGTLTRYLNGERTASRKTLLAIRAFLEAQQPHLPVTDWAELDELCERANLANGSPAVRLAQLKEELARVREEQQDAHHVSEERLSALEEQAVDLTDQLRQALDRAQNAESAERTLQDDVAERDENLRHAQDYTRQVEAELAQQQEQARLLLVEVGVLQEQNRRLLEGQQAVSAPETQPDPGFTPEYAHLVNRHTTAAEDATTGPQQHPQHTKRNPPEERTPTRPRPSRRTQAQARLRPPSPAWIVIAVVVMALCAYTAVTVVLAVPAVRYDLSSTLGVAASMITCNLLAAALTGWAGRPAALRYGPRLILLPGLILLAIGSLIASWTLGYDTWVTQPPAADWSALQLMTGCVLQGAGEGLCASAAGVVLATRFWYSVHDKATTWAVAVGSAIAVTASGLLLSTWEWRIAFQVLAAFALLLLITLPFLPDFRSAPLWDELGAADFVVLALVAGAHTAFAWAIGLTAAHGWWSPSVVALAALALTMLAKASRRLRRTEIPPPPNWIRGTTLLGAWVSGAVQYTAWLYCTIALQQVFDYEAWTAAALLLLAVPLAALTVFPRSFPTRLRMPARTIGFFATGGGLLWLSIGLSHPETFPTPSLTGALLLVGVGTAVQRCPPNGLGDGHQRAYVAQTKYSGALAVTLTASLITAHSHPTAAAYTVVLIVCGEAAVVVAMAGALKLARRRFRRPSQQPERAAENRP